MTKREVNWRSAKRNTKKNPRILNKKNTLFGIRVEHLIGIVALFSIGRFFLGVPTLLIMILLGILSVRYKSFLTLLTHKDKILEIRFKC